MRRHLFISSILAVALVACGSHKTVVTQQGNTVETDQLHQTVKVTGKQGTAIIGRNAVDPKELGLPLYPGSIPSEAGGLVTHSQQGTSQVISLNTKDSFDQVYNWYKQRMPAGSEQAHMSIPNGSVASFLLGKQNDADQRSVMISQGGAKITILLSHHTKNP